MGSLNRFSLQCPSCENNEGSPQQLFTHFYDRHVLKCTLCQLIGFKNQHEVDLHYKEIHCGTDPAAQFKCPLCGKTCHGEEEFTGHVVLRHRVSYKDDGDALMVFCSLCIKNICCDKTIVVHLREHVKAGETTNITPSAPQAVFLHNQRVSNDHPPAYSDVFGGDTTNLRSEQTTVGSTSNENTPTRPEIHPHSPLFKIGDRVNAMWGSTKYQYFPATIVEVHEEAKKCIVCWDDGDTTGLIVDFCDMAHDRIPTDVELVVGCRVLFTQGAYSAGDSQQTGGQRWHQGIITRIDQTSDSSRLYSGCHLKDERDGKSMHRGHTREFSGYRNTELREGISECFPTLESPADYQRRMYANAQPPPVHQIPFPAQQQQQQYLQSRNLPKCGDRVLAMWVRSKWQYFHATIRQVMPNLQYLIEWDDGDVTGLIVNCFDLAVDRIPDKNDIGVESIVLFQQGTYKAGADQQTGGIRWHQGKITRVYQANDGTTLYDGCHTKTEADGKWVTYKGYSQRFTGLKLEELRNGANIFDVIDDSQDALRNVGGALSHARGEGGACEVVESGEQRRMQESIEAKSKNYLLNMESKLKEAPPNPQERTNAEVDVFLSYCWYDSEIAKEKGHVVKCSGGKYSDPRRVHYELSKSFRTWLDIDCLQVRNDTLFQQHSDAIKKSPVFVAFVSDDYASNVFCRMQFQYACNTLKKHVLPIVVGKTGNDEWKNTVVGMLLQANENKFRVYDFRGIDSQEEFEKQMADVVRAAMLNDNSSR